MGADRAALFALPLAIAMFLVLAKFVQHTSSFSHLITDEGRRVLKEKTDPNATATREGDHPTTTSEEGEKQGDG